MSETMNRRSFVKGTAAGAVGLALAQPGSRVLGANEDIRVAVVGLNGRGGNHLSAFNGMDGVRVAALCDIDEQVLERRVGQFSERNQSVKTYTDFRKLLEDKEIDAISIATPNHWHSLMTVWGCQAGKDVYVEKPCSHNVFEGRQAVAAARKYNRIVQHGTQRRGDSRWARTIAAIQSGKYGKLLVAKGYCCKPRWSIGYRPYEEVPASVNFDLWLGPAPEQPFHRNLVHYNWHWFWDFGCGDIGNQGVHQVDVARWAIQGAGMPKSVVSMGGRYVDGPNFKDQGETPNQQLTIYDYGETQLLFETRGLVGNDSGFDRIVDNEFYLEAGMIKGHKFYPDGKGQGEDLVEVDHVHHDGDIFENFIDCVRSRNRDEMHADILEGHYSSAVCHLGNISYRLGWPRKFTSPAEAFQDGGLAEAAYEMVLDNSVKAVGMDRNRAVYTAGPKLTFNTDSEHFEGNESADLLLTRDYRAPFVVPENV